MIININSFDNKYIFPKENEEIELVFEKGEYHFYKDDCDLIEIHFSNTDTKKFPNKSIYFYYENLKDIVFDGNGSKFVFHGDVATFVLKNCENIKFKNITIDYHVPTAIEVYVKKIDQESKTICFEVPEIWQFEVVNKDIIWKSDNDKNGKPYWIGRNHLNSYANTIVDLESGFAKRFDPNLGPFSDIKNISKVKGTILIEYNNLPKIIKENTMIVLNSSMSRDNCGFGIIESSDITFENVNFNYLHGFGLLIQMSENIYFENCKFIGNERHQTSSFADGIHVSGAKGEIVIRDTEFDLTLDDPVNIHGTYTKVLEVNEKFVTLKYMHHQQAGFDQFSIGDEVQFFNSKNLQSLDEKLYKVKRVVHCPKDSNDLQTSIIEFEDLPKYFENQIQTKDIVCENVTYTPKVIIENSKFQRSPARGVLCTTRKEVKILNNIFENNIMASIFLSNDANEWFESGRIEDLEIKGNKFLYSKELLENENFSSILIKPIFPNGDLGLEINKNIRILENEFSQNEDSAIKIFNAKEVTVRNNKFGV